MCLCPGHSQPVWPVVSHAEVREEKNEQRTLELPNGMTCTYSSKLDVEFLYHEVYEKRGYLKHGVTLSPGNTVMDVGANIGFFAMSAAEVRALAQLRKRAWMDYPCTLHIHVPLCADVRLGRHSDLHGANPRDA